MRQLLKRVKGFSLPTPQVRSNKLSLSLIKFNLAYVSAHYKLCFDSIQILSQVHKQRQHRHTHALVHSLCVFKWNCLIRHKHIYSVEYLLNNLIWNPAPLHTHTHITLAVLQSRRTRTRRNNRSRQTNEAPQPQPQSQPHAAPPSPIPSNPSDWHSSSSTDVSNFLDLNTFNKSESGQTIQTERRRKKKWGKKE